MNVKMKLIIFCQMLVVSFFNINAIDYVQASTIYQTTVTCSVFGRD